MATANLPSKPSVLPAVFVLPDSGTFEYYGQARWGTHSWRALFLYAETSDPPRETRAVNRWMPVLMNAHTDSQLANAFGGTFADVTTTGYTVGRVTYAGSTYTGAELSLTLTTVEPWAPSPSVGGGIFDPAIFDPAIFDTGGTAYESVPEAIAAHYARGTLAAPGGSPTLVAIRVATARLPSAITVTPTVL